MTSPNSKFDQRSDPLDRALAPSAQTDLLADMLDALRVDSSTLGLFDLREPWGVEIDYLPFSTSWTIMDGAVWLIAPNGDTISFNQGDTLLFPRGIRGKSYIFASSPDVHPVRTPDLWRQAELEGFEPGEPSRRTQHIRWGGTGRSTRVVSTAFSFNDSQLSPFVSTLPELMIVRASETHGEGKFIDSLLRFAVDGEDAARPGFSSLATQIAQLLLVLVVRTYAVTVDKEELGLLRALGDPHMSRALHCIHRQPEVSWTVASLARVAGLSRSLFAERFLGCVGQTPVQYLRAWRMHLAREALASSKVAVATLAYNLGYHSEAAFRSAFRRCVGHAPKEFRRQAASQKMPQLTEEFAQTSGIRPVG